MSKISNDGESKSKDKSWFFKSISDMYINDYLLSGIFIYVIIFKMDIKLWDGLCIDKFMWYFDFMK
jgi:hypothetical protein